MLFNFNGYYGTPHCQDKKQGFLRCIFELKIILKIKNYDKERGNVQAGDHDKTFLSKKPLKYTSVGV